MISTWKIPLSICAFDVATLVCLAICSLIFDLRLSTQKRHTATSFNCTRHREFPLIFCVFSLHYPRRGLVVPTNIRMSTAHRSVAFHPRSVHSALITMKRLCLFVFVVLFVGARAWGRGDLEKFGPFQIALRSNLIKCDHDKTLNLDVSEINVYFYDFPKNDVETFTIENAADGILSIKDLDKSKKFIIFVGGFKSNINKRTEEQVRQTFRNFPNSYLIILDHSPYTNDRQGSIKSYERSVKYVHYIGKALADMLAKLSQGGVPPKSMHCIGHSLGSQILGQAGDAFFKKTEKKVWRITALDPAGPCFSNSLIQEQVRSGVAEYVEVYHCNAGGLGTTSIIADVDFFVNKKGQSQPNCGTPLIPGVFDSPKAAKCNHRACIDIWTATVAHPDWFTAWKCDTYKDFKKGRCSTNESTVAGFWNPGNATGVYYFSTEGYDL